MSLFRKLLVNPLSVYLHRTIRSYALEWKYRRSHLKIGYLSFVQDCEFGQTVTINNEVVITKTTIGDFSYISNGCVIAHTIFGKFCSVGPNVKIGLGQHPTDFVSTHPIFYSRRGQAQAVWVDRPYFQETAVTKIGNDVWVGANTVIRDGLSIGHGAIIGAGAVVTKDVPPYAIVGGVPAKLIRYRFQPEVISQLLQASWWDRDPQWLKKNFQSFHAVEDCLSLLRQTLL